MKITETTKIIEILKILNEYNAVTAIVSGLPKEESEEIGNDYDTAEVKFYIKNNIVTILYDCIEVHFQREEEFKLDKITLNFTRETHYTIMTISDGEKSKEIWIAFTNKFIGDKDINEDILEQLLKCIKESIC